MVLFIYHRQKATIDQKDKEMMLWGLVGLFVFVSVWGIIKLFQGFLSVEGTDINLPRVCVNGSCGAGSGNPGVSELAALSGDKPFDQNKLITGDYDASKVALWKIDNNFKNNKTWVAQLQKILNEKNGSNLTIDGLFGAKTTEAVKDFQRKNKLVDDGIVGESTKAVILYRYLNAPVTGDVYGTKNWSDISMGNGSASDITNLQKLLIDLGCYYGSASGTFDKATEDGVKLFQQKNYLVQDGIVGPSTRAVFLSPGTYSCK
jgi:peptidoglycan hydrolase-like protein with peptidoglycan-binding domain